MSDELRKVGTFIHFSHSCEICTFCVVCGIHIPYRCANDYQMRFCPISVCDLKHQRLLIILQFKRVGITVFSSCFLSRIYLPLSHSVSFHETTKDTVLKKINFNPLLVSSRISYNNESGFIYVKSRKKIEAKFCLILITILR